MFSAAFMLTIWSIINKVRGKSTTTPYFPPFQHSVAENYAQVPNTISH